MTPPKFFVPDVPADEAEAALRSLAALAGCNVPSPEGRVYRIEWDHDGQRWIAEVGRQLRGVQVTRTSRGRPGARVSDPAMVLAIFPGIPWQVVTDARPVRHVRSDWANPFFVGEPAEVSYFEASEHGVAE